MRAPRLDAKNRQKHEAKMPIDYIVGIAATVFLLIYLFYTLVRPEKF